MIAIVQQATAISAQPEHWHQINWNQAQRGVKRLQIRIAKATKNGNWRKVKALQRLLTRSFNGKAIAVKRVTENRGSRTAGIDGVRWNTPIAKWDAIKSLKRRGYQAKALRRIYIPKANGKLRPLGIPTMKDRAMQALYLLALEPVSETLADKHSYGFRQGRSTADAIEQCFVALSRKHSSQWVLEGDIKGCFDHIDHEWLMDNVLMDREILRKWLKSGFIKDHTFYGTKEGTPQGGIISPTLANIALDGLEKVLHDHFGRPNTKKSYKHKVNYVRYADDFIITGISKELLENEVKPLVDKFFKERGLSLSIEKTLITHIDRGFDFLGQNVRKYNDKLLIKPSAKNIDTFLKGIRETVKGMKGSAQNHVIQQLNPKIRGWANYHRGIVAKKTFYRVDYEIWKLLWQWSKRRHGNRKLYWVKNRYFHTMDNRKWQFAVLDKEKAPLVLLKAGDVKIKRHIKIKADANPFDPEWECYFEARWHLRWFNQKRNTRKTATLWMEQEGNCLHCHQPMDNDWQIHHIIYQMFGGGDQLLNLCLLHSNCHRQVHNLGLYVKKPVAE